MGLREDIKVDKFIKDEVEKIEGPHTTHGLGKYILETGEVPTPIYLKSREYKKGSKNIKFSDGEER